MTRILMIAAMLAASLAGSVPALADAKHDAKCAARTADKQATVDRDTANPNVSPDKLAKDQANLAKCASC